MKQLVINIPDKEYRFILKVIKSFSFVVLDEKKSKLLDLEAKLTISKGKIWKDIKEGFKEAELIEEGKIKSRSASEFLNDL